MNAAADSGDWKAVAALAEQRHGCLEQALAGDAWRVQTDVIVLLRGILDTPTAVGTARLAGARANGRDAARSARRAAHAGRLRGAGGSRLTAVL
jgi:hypothetical protein